MWIYNKLSSCTQQLLNWYLKLLYRDTFQSLFFLLRQNFDLPPNGTDDSLDVNVRNAVWRFVRPDEDKIEPNEDIAKFIDWLSQNYLSDTLREINLRIQHRLSSQEEERKSVEEVYRALYSRDLSLISAACMWRIRIRVRELYRRSNNAWLDKKYRKLEFGIKDLAVYVPIISFLLMCSGYFHIKILYGHFGIDPTQFFSIGDYLAASLQQIEHAILPCISYVVGAIFAYAREPLITRVRDAKEIRKDKIVKNIVITLSAMMIIVIGFTWENWATSPSSAAALGFPMVFVIYQFQSFIPLRFLKNETHGRLLLIAVVLFCALIVAGSYVKINMIKGGLVYKQYEVVSHDKIYTHENSAIIGSNSSYVFIWGKEKVWVIPWSNVRKIEVLPEKTDPDTPE